MLEGMKIVWKTTWAGIVVMALLVTVTTMPAQTEFHLQYGQHKNPFSGTEHQTVVFTVQQTSFWKYGDSFYFLDYLDDDARDGFNDRDFYGEWYPTLSLGKLRKKEFRAGPIRDFSLIGGVNVGGDAKVVKYLPGLRISWDLPGFQFLNTDLTAYIDDNTGLMGGGAPKTDDSFMFDVSWGLPFDLGRQSFAIVGHAEYIASRTNELGQKEEGWMLAQPQFLWDLGKAMAEAPQKLMVGIEYQYWVNKLGTDRDESVAQLLVVWRL